MRYAATTLLSAFLLFQVQPLVAKAILPWFGGSPSVWTTCMLFFQVVLVGGYAYAHILSSHVGARGQALIHTALLILALATLPILPGAAWKPAGDENPTLRILLLLTVSIGLPYFLLSSTGPLVQRWFAAATGGKSPYRLYALSNVGSVTALVSFPFLFEPTLRGGDLDWIWSILFGVFAFSCIATAWHTLAHAPAADPARAPSPRTPLPAARRWSWLGLAALPSVMLLATTNVLCQDVASVPFLWVAPLTVYLLTFILCFDSDRWYRRGLFGPLLAVTAVAALAVSILIEENIEGFWSGLPGMSAVYLALLFCAGMVCHGELAASRPAPDRLTGFYLSVSVGGAIGGIFVALVAPLVFDSFAEFWLGAVACAGLAGYAVCRTWPAPKIRWCVYPVLTALIFTGATFQVSANGKHEIASSRGFFGRLGVREDISYEQVGNRLQEVAVRGLRHGRILHGMQVQDDRRRGKPTTYFTESSGVGIAVAFAREVIAPQRKEPLHIGVIGLGAGTLAAYGQKGDRWRFYEIQPEVVDAADTYFTYLEDARKRGARIDIVLGDARIQLEREPANRFDLLVVDAFSSDAIPRHLLTRECADVYRKHLREDGLLAIHITNQYLDLLPVTQGIADHLEGTWLRFTNPATGDGFGRYSMWVVVTNNDAFLKAQGVLRAASVPKHPRDALLWTDDFSSLWHVLR